MDRPYRTGNYKLTYSWKAVQDFYDQCGSVRQTIKYFGMSNASWYYAKERGWITTKSHLLPLETLLTKRKQSRTHVKNRLIKAGIFELKCSCCGRRNWLGKPIPLHIDHINGDKDDWRLQNIRLLCPNCHNQTPTFAGKNKKLIRLRSTAGRCALDAEIGVRIPEPEPITLTT